LDTVINVHEAPRLISIAPDFNIASAIYHGKRHLSANRGGRFLAAAIPGPERAVDIVITRSARFETEMFAEVSAHPLAEKLLPAMSILRHGGIGIRLLEAGNMRIVLEQGGKLIQRDRRGASLGHRPPAIEPRPCPRLCRWH
jgi:hypothetical protein